MNRNRINEIMGYIIFGFGAAKTAYIFFVFTRVSFNLTKLLDNGNLNNNYFPIISIILAWIEIIVFVISIVMTFVNMNKSPKLIRWYLACIGAFFMAIFIPRIIFIFFAIPQSVIYINAGVRIRDGEIGDEKKYKKIKQDIKNTEWFYGKKDDEK